MYEQQQYHLPLSEDFSAGDLAYGYSSHLMFDPNTFPMTEADLDFDVDPSQYIDFFQQQQQQPKQYGNQSNHSSKNSSLEDMLYSTQDYLSSSSTSSIGTAPGSLPNQSLLKAFTDSANPSSYPDLSSMGHCATANGYPHPPPSSYGMVEYELDSGGAYPSQYLTYSMPYQEYGQTAPLSPSVYGIHQESKPQIYVRKACVSCKQSHVACDIQRPCNRCVRLNKGDTCVDAERKKRGRPCGSSKKKKEAADLIHPPLL